MITFTVFYDGTLTEQMWCCNYFRDGVYVDFFFCDNCESQDAAIVFSCYKLGLINISESAL